MPDQDQDIVHGVGGTTDQVPVSGTKKAAPMPEGLDEVNDRNLSAGSGGADQPGTDSGKGGTGPNTLGEKKGLDAGPGETNTSK